MPPSWIRALIGCRWWRRRRRDARAAATTFRNHTISCGITSYGRDFMTEGILMLPGTVLSASFVASLEARIVVRASAGFIAARVGASLLTPRLTKFIPYVGWAIMIGTAVYAGYEAYKSTEIDWNKLENGIYDAADLAMFRVGFTMARQQFLATAAGAAAQQAGSKYILIPSQVMPTVAQNDITGITQSTTSLTWEPHHPQDASRP